MRGRRNSGYRMDNAQIIKIILISAAVILCFIGIAAIALKIKSTLDYDKVRSTAKRNRFFLGRLLATQYRPSQYLLNVTLPYGPDGKDVGPVDAIVVLNGGIAVITANYYVGRINNPYQGQWSITDPHGQVYVFNNLFEQNLAVLEAVKTIMRRESVFNTPIHNLVMFGAKKVSLSRTEAQLLNADTLVPYLRDLDKDKFLKASQKKKIIKIFNKYRRKTSAVNVTSTLPPVRRMSQTASGAQIQPTQTQIPQGQQTPQQTAFTGTMPPQQMHQSQQMPQQVPQAMSQTGQQQMRQSQQIPKQAPSQAYQTGQHQAPQQTAQQMAQTASRQTGSQTGQMPGVRQQTK